MFKNILPSKRVPSSDFTMMTPLVESSVATGKENQPGASAFPPTGATKNGKTGATTSRGFASKKKRVETEARDQYPDDGVGMHLAFDQLLDDLQIPSTLRPKLAGMDSSVKAAMLKSSQGMTLNIKSHINAPPLTPRSMALRRTRSIDSLESPRPAKTSADYDLRPPVAPFVLEQAPSRPSSPIGNATPRKASGHSRGISLGSGLMSRSQVNLLSSASTLDLTAMGKSSKEKARTVSPVKYISVLTSTSSTQLDVEQVKKLRLLLRNESASWTDEFLRSGGYSALLTRLNEILEVEWREEQHDDQILHELLRCFKALTTSSTGCVALRSSSPTPFIQLVSLLYSDKKPGDVASRQLIVEMLLLLCELYRPSSLPSSGRSEHREIWDTDSSSNVITFPSPHKNFYSFIRALLLTPAPAPVEGPPTPLSPHEFIESLHRPRIYKTYLQELSDVCRDYFWVFCHPNNTIWLLHETDEGKVEKPRAPGGMTGGVEFEAMNYFTTHLRLINAIAEAAADLNLPKDQELSAHRLHSDLFLSGLERLILIARKASATYYPTLHLELARYVAHAGRAGFELPWTLSRLIGMPPAALCKSHSAPPAASGRSTPGSPSRRGARGSTTTLVSQPPRTPPRKAYVN